MEAARYGCQGWSRTIQNVAGLCAAWRTFSTGWSWCPSAEIAPETPSRTMLAPPTASIQPTAPWPLSRTRASPAPPRKVTAIAPTKKNVLTAWIAIAPARIAESLFVTQPCRTSSSPTKPSMITPTKLATAPLRARCFRGKARNAHTSIARMIGPSRLVVMR